MEGLDSFVKRPGWGCPIMGQNGRPVDRIRFGDPTPSSGVVERRAARWRQSSSLPFARGTGKTMLAKRLPTILPPLSFAETLEATKLYSVAGLLPSSQALLARRPLRAPHHSISDAGLIDRGSVPRPGEVSLPPLGAWRRAPSFAGSRWSAKRLVQRSRNSRRGEYPLIR